MENFLTKNTPRTILVFFAAAPLATYAAPETFGELLQVLVIILGWVLMLIYIAAVLFFVLGIAKFVFNTEDEAKRTEGKQWMLWAVITFFVAISLWGVVGVFSGTFGLGDILIPQLPQ